MNSGVVEIKAVMLRVSGFGFRGNELGFRASLGLGGSGSGCFQGSLGASLKAFFQGFFKVPAMVRCMSCLRVVS